jgi:hypothetical protein
MTNQSPETAAPGYYPTSDGRYRYWDGSRWSNHYASHSNSNEVKSPGGPSSSVGDLAGGQGIQHETYPTTEPSPPALSPHPGLSRSRKWLLPAAAVGALVIGLLMGSALRGSPSSTTVVPLAAEPNVTVTVTPPPVTATTTVTAGPAPAAAAAPSPPTPAATQTSAAVLQTVVVPDAVGKDYQTAQELWRAAGLHVMPAVDALGANRLAVIDANWVVVSQSPAAGGTLPRDAGITATIKKYTDK